MSAFISALEEAYIARVRGYYRLRQVTDIFRKPLIPISIYSSPYKLNLGSSNRSIPGYTNVDALKERNPDIVCDVRKLKFAADNEYDLLRASHVLEHFAPAELAEILAEWRRVLKVSGYLVVCVPDYIVYSWRAILRPSGFDIDAKTLQNGWVNGIYALDLPPEFRHQSVFTYKSLVSLLTKSGFKVLGKQHFRTEQPYTLGILDDSCHPSSLNVVALKI